MQCLVLNQVRPATRQTAVPGPALVAQPIQAWWRFRPRQALAPESRYNMQFKKPRTRTVLGTLAAAAAAIPGGALLFKQWKKRQGAAEETSNEA